MVEIPAEYRGRFLDISGFGMHYRDEGSGPPVVCLHGNPTWSYMFRDVIAELRSHHRVIAPDHIGCGLSDKPSASSYPFTLRRRIDDLDELLNSLLPTGKLSLLLHDWGGMIGMAWAVDHAERIDKLVVMNTAAFPLPAGKKLPGSLRIGRMPMLGQLLIQGLNLFCRGAAAHCVVRQPLRPDVRALYLAPYNTWRNRTAVERFVRTIPVQSTDAGYDIVAHTEQNLRNLAGRPMLLAWGMKDFVFDADFLRTWRRHFPHAEVCAVADAGHYLLEDAGTEILPRIVTFLNRP
jgi:haloalkane dehalogenase